MGLDYSEYERGTVLPSSRFSRIAISVAAVLAAVLFLVTLAVTSPAKSHFLSELVQFGILLWAAVCAFVVARRSTARFRQLWGLLAASLALAAAGQLLVFYYAVLLKAPRSTPWPSDVLLFVWVAPAAMMLLPWRLEASGLARWERGLDFAQIFIVFVTAYLYFFYVPSLWWERGAEMFSRLMEAVVARDVLLAGAFLARSVTLPRSGARTLFGRVAVFFAALGVVEAVSIAQLGASTRAADWADACWALPFLLVAVQAALWSAPAEALPEAEASGQSGWVVSQAFPVAIPLLVLYMGSTIAREQITIAALAIAAAFACAAARLLLTTQRQRRIAEDLRRAEQARGFSEKMFSAAFRSSPDAVSIALVPEGAIQEINESFTRLTGLQREEVIGKVPEELGLWVDQDRMQALRAEFREAGEIRDAEVRFRRKDGEIRFGQLSGAIITLDERRYSLIVVRDTTESKKADEALRATEERFRNLVRDLQVGVALVRPNGEILYANPATLELFGLREDQIVGRTVAGLGLVPVHEDGTEMPLEERPVAQAIQTRQPVRGTVMGWKSGDPPRVVWIIGNAIPQLNREGEVEYVIASFADITNLRKTEEALRSSEERFRSLVRILRVGISTWGPDGRLQYVNDALVEMFGQPREPILGKRSPEILPAIHEDGTPIPAEMRPAARVIATRQPVRNQIMGWPLPISGRTVWTLVDAAPEFTPDGNLVRVIASLTNITDLKRAEEEKRVSQEMFIKAFHSSPDAVTISTVEEGRYVEVNEGYTRLFGWRRDEVIGKTTIELGEWPDPTDREALRSLLREEGRVRQMELQLRTKSGRMRAFRISADVIELNGQACMLAVSDDITDWKEAQEALRFSEHRFRTLVQNLDVGVVLYGADGRIQFANQAALQMVRLRPDEVLDRKNSELGLTMIREDGSEQADSTRPVNLALETGQPVREMVLGLQLPGVEELTWIFGNVIPLFAEDGKIAGALASFANISEQKRSAEALRQLSGRLLRLQDEERRRLGRDLHDSLAQNVLAVNLSLAQITQSSAAMDERNRRALSEARTMLQEMSRQIRTLSYLLHPPLLDELGLASAVKEYAHGFSERSGKQVQVGVSPGFGRLPQETETALFRIVQESLANIQRHSSSPSARIRLDGTPRRITLEVSDQGHGIPESKGRTLNQPGARFGVGIAGMRERMAQLGGTLEIESGKSGTTVRATLPVSAEVLDAAARSGGG